MTPSVAGDPTGFRFIYRVPYSDCTVGNHVYYARYLDILEQARGEYLRSLGTSFLILQERGIIFPVIAVELRYSGAARYDDELTVMVRITEARRIRLNFAYTVRNQKGDLLVEGETRHVCTDLEDHPRRLPDEIPAP